MSLPASQLRTLQAACETLLPGAGDELAELVVQTLATSGNPQDLAELRLALGLLESPVAGLLLDGRLGRFTALDREGRELVLRRWATHPLAPLRKAFQALKRLSGFLYLAAPGGTAVHEALGYAGAPTVTPGVPALNVHPLQAETTLKADAVVVGSGAGGGVAAARLAARGLKVIILEKGGYHPEPTLGMPEREGMEKLYLDRGMTATRDLSVAIMAGSAVGGGTLVNWTACIAPPAWLREEWEHEYGLEGLTSAAFQSGVDDLLSRLSVNTEHSASLPASSAGKLLAGCEALGYQAAELPRNVRNCGEDCSLCTFGCRAGAKQSTARTYLADAVDHGAMIIPDADVRRVLVAGGRVTGVEAMVNGRIVTVKAPRVVMAAGAIGTPAVLLRSGLANPNIGRHLHLHPVAIVVGTYAEPIRPWSGRLLPAYSSQFARTDGNYGFLLEVAPGHPGMAGMALPWESGAQYMRDLQQMDRSGVFIALVRDRDSGRVTVDRAGRHRIDYALSDYDRRHLLEGQREAIRVHAAAGANRIMTLHSRYNTLERCDSDSAEAFADRSRALPSGPNQLLVFSAHQMGSCRMGRSPSTAVADARGQVFGVGGLYIADASAFPAASGVNPMITIMCLAHWVAGHIE